MFKYKRNVKLGNLLAEKMAGYIKQHYSMADIDLITAIPLHRSKQKIRGFNQSDILAQRIANNFNMPFSAGNLIRHKKTKSQYNLNRQQRAKNLKNAFRCQDIKEFQHKSVLLVDDIYTTGITLNECAKVIKNAGAR